MCVCVAASYVETIHTDIEESERGNDRQKKPRNRDREKMNPTEGNRKNRQIHTEQKEGASECNSERENINYLVKVT